MRFFEPDKACIKYVLLFMLLIQILFLITLASASASPTVITLYPLTTENEGTTPAEDLTAKVNKSDGEPYGAVTKHGGGMWINVTSWNESIPTGAIINDVTAYIQHCEKDWDDSDARFQYSTDGGGSWIECLDLTESSYPTKIEESCDLTSVLNTSDLVNDSRLRYYVYDIDAAGKEYGYVDVIYMNVTYATPPTITFISQTPADLGWNSTGLVNITYNVTDSDGINKSTAYLAHSVYHNHPEHEHSNWSWRYPVPNPLTSDGRRACNRNESRWFEPDFDNIWKWGIHDNDSMDLTLIRNGTYANGTEWATWNFSTNHIFPNAYPLERREMQAENKSGQYTPVYSGNLTVFKIEHLMLHANASLSAYVYVDDQGSPENLLIYYCNNTFDPENPKSEPWTKDYCQFVTSLPNTFDYLYSKRNSSYAEFDGMWIDENLKYINVTVTETGYFLFRSSATFAQAWKIFYADDDNIAGTMGFNETYLTWNSSDNGGNWTQFNGTIDLWFTQTTEYHDEIKYYFSVRDNLGNWGNSTIRSDTLSPYNKPPTRPNILTPTDGEVIGGTSYNIQWQEGGDPDNDDYNASVYLYNPDGIWNTTLADDNISKFTEHYEFNTTTVLEGTYRLNVTLNDTYGASSSTLTGYNFTITQPPVVQTPHTYDNTTLEEKTVFTRNEGMTVRANVTDWSGRDDIKNVSIKIQNTTDAVKVDNLTMTNITEITNGYTYEYNYTIPSDASYGTWTINVYANDTKNAWDSNTTTFGVYATTLEIKNQTNITAISSINFSGASGDTVSDPWNNEDGSGSKQDISTTTPVATIYNPSSSTNYTIWLKVTAGSGWDMIISDEKFNVTDDATDPGDVSTWTSLKPWGGYNDSWVTVNYGTYKDLYLAFYLKGSGTETSTLSVLGEKG